MKIKKYLTLKNILIGLLVVVCLGYISLLKLKNFYYLWNTKDRLTCIYQVTRTYSSDNDDLFPKSLNQIAKYGLKKDNGCFTTFEAISGYPTTEDFPVYYLGNTFIKEPDPDSPDKVFLIGREKSRGYYFVLYAPSGTITCYKDFKDIEPMLKAYNSIKQ